MLSLYLYIAGTEDECRLIEKLYKEKRQRMFSVARRYSATDEDAEDAVHEAFLRIAEGKTGIFRIPPEKLDRYLDVMIRNICVDVIKQHIKEENYLKETSDECEASLEDEALAKISHDELLDSVRELPVSQRDAMYLKIVMELSDKEGAKALGISETAFRQRLSAARKTLRKLIEKRDKQ